MTAREFVMGEFESVFYEIDLEIKITDEMERTEYEDNSYFQWLTVSLETDGKYINIDVKVYSLKDREYYYIYEIMNSDCSYFYEKPSNESILWFFVRELIGSKEG